MARAIEEHCEGVDAIDGAWYDCRALRQRVNQRRHGMVLGMATRKITITLGEDQIVEIRALVAAGQAPNVSAFVQHAVGVALSDAAGWREMLQAALEQTGGPLTAKERAWADTLLSTPEEKKRPRKGKAA